MNLQSFHFLRPEWLLAAAFLVPVLVWVWRRRDASAWERICEPYLLQHLLAAGGPKPVRLALAAFSLAWVAACVALAGPTWERLPQPAFEDPSRTVFVLGLAPSMEAQDVAPSRMARARHKLQDALNRLGAGSAGLVVYREEAFAAIPLTDDLQVLRELVPLLETNLAPGRRVFPARGIEEATRLLEPVGLTGAHIVLVTDGTDDDPQATRGAAAAAARGGARVSVLAVAGTSQRLEEVAASGRGTLATLTADDRDLAQILGGLDLPLGTTLSKSERTTDAWRDMGVWLVWIPLLLAPLAFRKGWATAALALVFLQLPTGSAQAGVLDWFQRPDQRGARAFAEEEYEASAAAFEDPAWRGAAQYRAGNFEAAADALANRSDADSIYNRGNALARAGRLEEALAAYDSALAAKPEDQDAQFNRDLVKRLLDEQKPPPPKDAEQPKGDSDDDEPSSSQGAASEGEPESSPGENPDDGDAESSEEQSPAEETSPATASETPDGDATAGEQETAGEQGTAGDRETAMERAEPDGDESGQPSDMAGQESQPAAPGLGGSPISPEQQDAARWMARLPDDPGGLLREKIRRDYLRKRYAREQGGSL